MDENERGAMFFSGILIAWLFGSAATMILLHLAFGFSGVEAIHTVIPWTGLVAFGALTSLGIGFVFLALTTKEGKSDDQP